MNSLFERALARPYLSTALLLGAIAAAALLWWLFCPVASVTPKPVTNAPATQSAAQLSDSASGTAVSEITATNIPSPLPAVNTLPTDPALAEEELDRLNDEHSRLQGRKTQLAQQLEISNKLLAMKEQQVKTLETPAP